MSGRLWSAASTATTGDAPKPLRPTTNPSRCVTCKSQYQKSFFSQEEICQENYVKSCFIEYQQTAQNVTVSVCRVPLVKDCDSSEEQVSRTVMFIRNKCAKKITLNFIFL